MAQNSDTKLREVGAVNIQVPEQWITLDEANPPSEGWTRYHLLVEDIEALSFMDYRAEVYDAAEAVWAIARKIADAKKSKENYGKLVKTRATAITVFKKAVQSAGIVNIQEMIPVGNTRRRSWQRVVVYDLEEKDVVNGQMNAIRYFGEARSVYQNPFWSINFPDSGGVQPIIAWPGKPAEVLDIENKLKIIRKVTVFAQNPTPVIAFYDLREEPTPEIKFKSVQAQLDPPPSDSVDETDTPPIADTPATEEQDFVEKLLAETTFISCPDCGAEITVNSLDFAEALTVRCGACKTTVGPLINGTTYLGADAIGVKVGLTNEQLNALDEHEPPVDTLSGLIHFGDQELKKLLGLKKITEARKILHLAEELVREPEESEDES